MKKLLYVLAVFALGSLFSACEQEEITPNNQPELIDSDMTEGDGGEEDGGVKSN